MPERIQLSRAKGWRMPPNTVSVARPARWGNPFKVALVGRERAVEAFRDWCRGFFSGPDFADLTDAEFGEMYASMEAFERRLNVGAERRGAIRRELRGKNLACWCRFGEPCHADVLLEIANQPRVPGESSRDEQPNPPEEP